MVILGFSCFTHDAAAALLIDGKLVGASEEERFVRIKHTHEFPQRTIRHLLDDNGLTIADVDHVAYHMRPWVSYPHMVYHFWRYFPRTAMVFRDRFVARQENDYVAYGHLNQPWEPYKLHRRFREFPGGNRAHFRFHFVEHHIAHNASAFFLSPFEEAACLSIDGCGEWPTTMLAEGRGHRIHPLRRIQAPHSLGMLYNSVCQHLGFTILDGPGKVMGLAPYGDPAPHRAEMEKLVRLHDDGTFSLDMSYFNFHVARRERRCSDKFVATFGSPREPNAEITREHMNLAASLQLVLEEAVLRLAAGIHRRTGMDRLCLSGGVALNSVANGRLVREGPFKDVFIQPAAGDAGCAIGAALHVEHNTLGRPRHHEFRSAALGAHFTDEQIRATIDEYGLAFVRLDQPAVEAAALLAGGKIVGWFQGRAEVGPRALGQRSILTAPFPAEMKDTLNRRVKHRESFRPFAPVVPEEHLAEWFESPTPSPYMLLVHPVREDKRSRIPAVTHVDGSARVQSVNAHDHPLLHQLVVAFGEQTGTPVILNTSFNIQGMPIVNSPEDALDCLLGTQIDCLIIGNYRVDRPSV